MKKSPGFFNGLSNAFKGSGKMFLYWVALLQLRNPQSNIVAQRMLEDANALKAEGEAQFDKGCQTMRAALSS